jgi:DNA-binding NarL/FixJ family response regulator
VPGATTGDEALALAFEYKPDILLLDVNMPGKKSIEVVKEVKNELKTKILILSAFTDACTVIGLLKAGADGYLIKDDAVEDLPMAIKNVYAGKMWLSPQIPSFHLDEEEKVSVLGIKLTPRELEILEQVKAGSTNMKISQEMGIAKRTVQQHLSNIFKKLGVNSRVELIVWVQQHGLPIE